MPIDPTVPPSGAATTAAVRANFQATIDELAAAATERAAISTLALVASERALNQVRSYDNIVNAFARRIPTPTSGQFQNATQTALRATYRPIIVNRLTSFSAIKALIAIAGGTTLTVAIYDTTTIAASDQPRNRVTAAALIPTTGDGWRQAALAATLQPDLLYWLACVTDGAPNIKSTSAQNIPPTLGWSTAGNPIQGYYATLASPALDATAPTALTEDTAFAQPLIFVAG